MTNEELEELIILNYAIERSSIFYSVEDVRIQDIIDGLRTKVPITMLESDIRARIVDMLHRGVFVLGPMWALKLRPGS